MSDEHDPILDACLDEVLGGQTPPDLTARIMQAWSMLPPALPSELPAAPPVQNPVSIRPDLPSSGPGARRPGAHKTRGAGFRVGLSVAVAASVVLVGLGLIFALRATPSPAPVPADLAQQPDPPPTGPGPAPLVAPSAQPREQIVETPLAPRSRNPQPEVITPQFGSDPPFATVGPGELAIATPPAAPALADRDVVAAIDTAIESAWREHAIAPANPSSDDEFARRLYQQLLGRGPNSAELQTFLDSRDKEKRAWLVNDLLSREANVIEFARHWSGLWADSLVGRSELSGASREGLEQYLRRALQQAKPLDQLATELITATGVGEIGTPQYNGAANFLLAHHGDNASRATAHVARAFLGKRLQCAQCHDHPGDTSIAQNRFWELNTFLRQVRVEASDEDDAGPPLLVSRDFHGDGGGDGSEAEVFYETPSGEVKVAYPALPGVRNVPRSGIVNEFDRRAGLARYIVSSQDFRRVLVNRVWANVFGYGFTSPVDDLGPHNPPSHPELLDDLADQLAAHDFDLRRLIRWMVLSEPFQLGSSATVNLADAPELGGQRWFSRSYPSLPSPAAPQDSLVALAKARANGLDDLGAGTTANIKPQFPAAGGTGPAERLGPLAIASQTGGGTPGVPPLVERIIDGDLSVEQKLEHLFLVAVQRAPTRREWSLVGEIASEDADRTALLQVWQALSRGRD